MVVKINGKEYEAKASIRNLKLFKEKTGKSLLNEEVLKNFDETLMADLIYAMVGGRVDMEEIEDLEIFEASAIAEKIMDSMQDKDAKKK